MFPHSPKAMPCFAAPERGETRQIMHKHQTYAARSAIKFFWFLFFQEKERPPGEGKKKERPPGEGKQGHNWEHACDSGRSCETVGEAMKQDLSILLPVLLPVLGGVLVALLPLLRGERARQRFVAAVLVLTAAAALRLMPGPARELRFTITETVTVYFRTDELSCVFSALILLMWLLSGLFSFSYMRHETHHSQYYCFFLLSQGALLGLALAGNYITLYLCFEWMTLLTTPLVLHSGTREAGQAATQYQLYSVAGASLGLLGIPLLLRYGTTLDFTPGGVLDPAAVQGHEGVVRFVFCLVLLGFGAKAGLYPLFAWLPAAHPVAPAPASAVLSGVITKAGVLAILRVLYYAVGPAFLAGTWVQTFLLGVALGTVLMGSTMALKEKQLKKRMAYSTVSQVSYILFGLFLLNGTAMTGALVHVVAHSVCKDALFLSAGAIIFKTGRTEAGQMRGIGKEMPIVLWCYTLASLALVGIPPLCGFLSKWYLCLGALESGLPVFSWLGPVILIVSALLTAAYLLPITVQGFFPGQDYDYGALVKKEPDACMCVPLLLLAAATAFSVAPGPLLALLRGIVSAVFGSGGQL